MILHRIASKADINDLSGTGSMMFGGRWNIKGIRVVYTSESLSLAALETIANLSSNQISKTLYRIEIDFPDELPITVTTDLPLGWDSFPYSSVSVNIGTDYFHNGGLCLKVPSAIISQEYNYLLNPIHEDFQKVKVLDSHPLLLDRRLVKIS